MIILPAKLQASSHGTPLPEPYRAALLRGDGGAMLEIQQSINGQLHGCGRWYLSTLLEHGASDGLSIDYGQNWQVDSGLKAAIDEAILILADGYNTDKGTN